MKMLGGGKKKGYYSGV